MTQPTPTPDLMACPFCGAPAKHYETNISPEFHTSMVRCTKCHATIGEHGGGAAMAWNTRHQPTPAEDEITAIVSKFIDSALASSNGEHITSPDHIKIDMGSVTRLSATPAPELPSLSECAEAVSAHYEMHEGCVLYSWCKEIAEIVLTAAKVKWRE